MPVISVPLRQRRDIYFCFFLSGATALIYQVIWARLLGLVFGNTMYAISLVLAIFMGGLGIGNFFADNFFLRRYPKPLTVYAILELGIGLWAILTPFLLKQIDQLHIILHPLLQHSLILDSLLHFGLSSLVILIPTIFMGATLPTLTTCCTEKLHELSGRLSLLYALNTLGAVIGTWWVGFYALPWLGINLTNYIAAFINIGIGLHFLFVQKSENSITTITQPDPVSPTGIVSFFLIAGMVVAGFSAMIYEVAWTRVLILILGSSTYAFSCILIAFLTGITLGSFIFNLLWKKINLGLREFCFVEILIGTFSLVSLPVFSQLPRFYITLYHLLPYNNWAIQFLRLLVPVVIMIIPATFMGFAFPLAGKLYSIETKDITSCICRIYGASTLGNVCGAICAGFLFLNILGAQNTLKLAIILNLSIGISGLLLNKTKSNLAVALIALFVGAGTLFQPAWNKYLLSRGVSIYARGIDPSQPLKDPEMPNDIIFYKEGINDVVTVLEHSDGNRSLKINGKADASTNSIDMSTQLLLGYIPLFLQPNSNNALIIGLGIGVTAKAVAEHNTIEEVDCVEIEPAVVEAAEFFNHYNNNLLQNPKVNIIVEDASSHLKLSSKNYDLIISEPSNPWIKGIGNLFSLDFYNLCRQRLRPGGVMCQWIQIYELSPEILRMAINSFRQAFPYCQLWFNPPSNAFILGSEQPLIYDLDHIEQFVKRIMAEKDNHDLVIDSPLGILAYFELNNEEITEFVRGAELNTDNYPRLEFAAPYFQALDTIIPNYRLIRSYKKNILPPNIKIGNRELNRENYFYGLSRLYYKTGMSRRINQYIQWADQYINEAININGNDPRFYIVRGRIYVAREIYVRAVLDFERALELESDNYEPHHELARIYQVQQKWQKATAHYRSALELAPHNEELRVENAEFLASLSRQQQTQSIERQMILSSEL